MTTSDRMNVRAFAPGERSHALVLRPALVLFLTLSIVFVACGSEASQTLDALEVDTGNVVTAPEDIEDTEDLEDREDAATTPTTEPTEESPTTTLGLDDRLKAIAEGATPEAVAPTQDAPTVEVAGITATAATDTAATTASTSTTTTIEANTTTSTSSTSTSSTSTAVPATTTTAASPTTIAPATAPPTTIAPTTAPITTAPPTTIAPTTVPPTTVAPTPPRVTTDRFPSSPLAQVGPNFDGALLGVSTGLSTAEREPRFNYLEEQAGRQFDIGHVFHAWDKPIPTVDDLIHLQEGRILMISWNGTDTIEIQNGVHDDWIRSQATAVRELEQPVMLRWLWEMDANRRREWVHSGDDFVGAWNHIRSIFDEVGADNAEFVWCPNAFLFWNDGDPSPWYPGDENVDWLCADGYNWGDATTDSDWMTFTDIFEEFVAWAEPRNLPIVIAETGSNEASNDPNARANWLRNVPASLRNDLPAIDAVIYFDKDFTFAGHPDWRVDTTPQAFDAWNEIASDEYLNPLG